MKNKLVFSLVVLCFTVAALSQHIDNFLASDKNFDPNIAVYPNSSFVDHSNVLEAPAGRYGFVTSLNGHFYFENGKRIRFFGINIAKSTIFIEYIEIDKIVNLFADSGINMVRIHHIDDTDGIIGENSDDGYFDQAKIDKLDYFIAELKKRGIYICLDLNDYRTFKTSEGIVNGERLGRGAKPYAVFDQKLLERQKDFAKAFLVDHINSYTDLSYADDPAVALIEIYDENGLFIRREEWGSLISPYKEQLTTQWNLWLRYKYGNTDMLKLCWTDNTKKSALKPSENLENGTVSLPVMSLLTSANPSSYSYLDAPARVNDGAQFAADIQRDFQSSMQWYLRSIGVKVPITAVGGQDIITDIAVTALANDYIGINHYWDHPAWTNGNSWRMPSYFYLYNPLTQNIKYTFPVVVAQSRVEGKPLVVRELGYCYPNPYRSVGIIEAAAYGAFLDIDAILLFTYDATIAAKDNIGYFNIRLDPLRYNLISTSARIFYSGEISKSKHNVGVGYSDTDTFMFTKANTELYYLAFNHSVKNYFDTSVRQHPFDLLVTSGKSSESGWAKSEKMLAFAINRNLDLYQNRFEPFLERQYGYYIKTSFSGGRKNYQFTSNIGYSSDTYRNYDIGGGLMVNDLQNALLIPISVSGDTAYGFIDNRRKFACYHVGTTPLLAYRTALDLMNSWYLTGITHKDIDSGHYVTDTKEITRDIESGRMTVVTPNIVSIAGDFKRNETVDAGAVSIKTDTPIAVLTAESLDSKPLSDSDNYLIMMITKADNTNIKLYPVAGGPKPNKLENIGTMPIKTSGTVGSNHLNQIFVNGSLILSTSVLNGNLHYIVEGKRSLLYMDTHRAKVSIGREIDTVKCHFIDGLCLNIEYNEEDNSFVYPENVRVIEVVFK